MADRSDDVILVGRFRGRIITATGSGGLLDESHTRIRFARVLSIQKFERGSLKRYELRNRDTGQRSRKRYAVGINADLPEMRFQGHRDDAARCLSVLLCLQGLRREAEAESRRLLRILLLRIGALPAGPAARQGIVLRLSCAWRSRSGYDILFENPRQCRDKYQVRHTIEPR